MKAMIFAAGLGTRLKPLTDTMPKAMVPVGERPLLAHIISRLVAAGIGEICVNVYHFAEQIIDYLESNPVPGVSVSVSDERPSGLLETGGGILAAEPFLAGAQHHSGNSCPAVGEPILIHNVDILSNLDLRAFVPLIRPEDLATLVVSERKTSRYLLFDDDMLLRGWTDVRTGEVRGPASGGDISGYRRLAFSGIHVVSPRIFDAMRRCGFSGRFSIIDFYLSACATMSVRGYVPDNFAMIDVGKLDALAAAEQFLKEHLL